MTDHDKAKFLESMNACSLVYQRSVNKELLGIYFNALLDFEIDAVALAISQHIKRCKFFPTVADIVELIPANGSAMHIGADEAWSIAIESLDEASTVVLTAEIAEALAVARPIYLDRDKVGARVAFRDAYGRIVKTAGKPVWFVSEGFDAARRVDAVDKAIALGRLPANYCSHLRIAKATATVSGLIASSIVAADASGDAEFIAKAKKNIGALKALLSGGDDGVARREGDRVAFEAHRDAELAKLATRH